MAIPATPAAVAAAAIAEAAGPSTLARLRQEEDARLDRVILFGILSYPVWSVLAAILVSGRFGGVAMETQPLVVWGICNVASGASSLALLRLARRWLGDADGWRRVAALTMVGLLAGFGWAALPWVAWNDEALTRMTIAGILLGFCTSSVARHVFHPPAFRAMYGILMVSLAIRFLVSGIVGWHVEVLAIGLILFAVLIWVALGAEAFISDHRRTQILRFESEAMARALATARDETVAARLRAEYAARAKTDFLSNMSHELRTPLNAIVGFAGLLGTGVAGPLSPRQGVYVDDIGQAGRRLLGLINDVLDLSRIEAGMARLDVEKIDLDEALDSAIAAIRPLAEEPGVRIERVPAVTNIALRADQRRLVRMVAALVSNAVKFSHSGGMVTVEVGLQPGARVRIAVIDRGVGMDPGEVPMALEPFRQLDAPGTRVREGVGLGLPIADRLARMHGGSLSLDSEPGEGTRAVLDLPLDGFIGVPPPPSRARSAPTGGASPRTARRGAAPA